MGKIFLALLILGITLFGLIGLGFMHESIHKEIYQKYGIDSEIHMFGYFPDFMTVAEEPCPTEECILAHNINEAVGYPLGIILGVFILFAVIIVLELDKIKDCLENRI